MTDTVSAAKRSEIMSAIRPANTQPELRLRSVLHRQGYRYRVNVHALPGRPDLVFPSRRKVIFVNGCFWHRHHGCRYATLPKSRVDYWTAKFAATVERDKRNAAALRRLGWKSLVVWECELRQIDRVLARVVRFLG